MKLMSGPGPADGENPSGEDTSDVNPTPQRPTSLSGKWAVLRKKVSYVLCLCHAKRRMGAAYQLGWVSRELT